MALHGKQKYEKTLRTRAVVVVLLQVLRSEMGSSVTCKTLYNHTPSLLVCVCH